jgi:hypothetical protein
MPGTPGFARSPQRLRFATPRRSGTSECAHRRRATSISQHTSTYFCIPPLLTATRSRLIDTSATPNDRAEGRRSRADERWAGARRRRAVGGKRIAATSLPLAPCPLPLSRPSPLTPRPSIAPRPPTESLTALPTIAPLASSLISTSTASRSRASRVSRIATWRESAGAPSSTTIPNAPLLRRRSPHQATRSPARGLTIQSRPLSANGAQSRGASERLPST